jgi:malic enzyme
MPISPSLADLSRALPKDLSPGQRARAQTLFLKRLSFALSNRGNLVAIVSDSTRVLGDGDCDPPGGLGV